MRPLLPGAPTRAESAENVMPELTRKLRAVAESDDVDAIDALIGDSTPVSWLAPVFGVRVSVLWLPPPFGLDRPLPIH